MRQATLLICIGCCVLAAVSGVLFSAYLDADIRQLSKIAYDYEPPQGTEQSRETARFTARALELNDSAMKMIMAGWFVGMVSLAYALILVRRVERLEDRNATLEADMLELRETEQVAASDR